MNHYKVPQIVKENAPFIYSGLGILFIIVFIYNGFGYRHSTIDYCYAKTKAWVTAEYSEQTC